MAYLASYSEIENEFEKGNGIVFDMRKETNKLRESGRVGSIGRGNFGMIDYPEAGKGSNSSMHTAVGSEM